MAAEVTVYPESPSIKQNQSSSQQISIEQSQPEEEEKHQTQKVILSPSVAIILENALFSIDPLLLIRICSFLDMLSVMRFQCVSLRLSKFLKKNIQLQSLQQSNTDYFIDHALNSPSQQMVYYISYIIYIYIL